MAGLNALARHGAPDAVLIHDGARPFVNDEIITNITTALSTKPAAIPAVPVSDTLQRTDGAGLVTETLSRDRLWRAQTPQGFAFDLIIKAHQDAVSAARLDFTDDAAVFAWAGGAVHVVDGAEQNLKITTAEDLATANHLFLEKASKNVSQPSANTHIRTGSGFDVHRAVAGDHVWLCGVKVAAPFALSGHSDADVALHAVTDALFGALGDGDIGSHFPPSDPQWKGTASEVFLAFAKTRVAERGGSISHVDITVICEMPKVGPHREPMRARVAEILELAIDQVSVKATTTEGPWIYWPRRGYCGHGIGDGGPACPRLDCSKVGSRRAPNTDFNRWVRPNGNGIGLDSCDTGLFVDRFARIAPSTILKLYHKIQAGDPQYEHDDSSA